MLAMRIQSLAYEKQTKFIQDRITSVEKNFSELCSIFALYARKVARLRDAGDEISRNIKIYSDNETVNKSLSAGLADVAITLCAIEEYRNIRAQRLEVKVVGELSQYEGICRHVRSEIKHTLSLRDSEINRKKALDKIKEKNPLNRQQITHAEGELLKASADMTRTAKELEKQTDSFEKRKLESIKQIMKTFIEVELSFQAKALELYTVAYQQINNIDCESDMQEYQNQIQTLDEQTIHKQPGLGSIASLLGQQEKTRSKSPMDDECESSSDSDTEDSSEVSLHKSNESFYQ